MVGPTFRAKPAAKLVKNGLFGGIEAWRRSSHAGR
jgi:hypothetical protein